MENIFKPEKKEDLKWLKENIDIRQYLEGSGYTLDKSRNTKRYMAYHHEERGDKIYVPIDNRYQVPSYYVNQYDKSDKGSIVDFVMSREKKSLEEARRTLRNFQPAPQKPGQDKEQLQAEAAEQQKRHRFVIDRILKEGVLKDHSYLRSRFLEEETIGARAFKGKLLQNDAPDGRFWVFPLREPGSGRVEGMALKNAEGERVLGRRSGLWISSPSKNLKAAVEQLVITESPIDAMSYYQLHKDRMLKENTVLISSAGSPGKEQLNALRELFRQTMVSRVVLANDADKAGEQYDKAYQELLRELNQERKESPVEVRVEKPVFKDFNADIRARKLLELRQLEAGPIDRAKQLEPMRPIREELEKLLYEKAYPKLSAPDKLRELQQSYVVRELDGHRYNFTIRELAIVNNQPKLRALVEKEIEVNAEPRQPSLAVNTPRENRPKQTGAGQEPAKEGGAAFREAQPAYTTLPEKQSYKIHKDASDEQLEKAYFRTMDKLQKEIKDKEGFGELYRRLDMYRHYPHLNEEEIDTYLGLQQRLGGGLQQQLSVTKGKGKELDTPGL